MPLPWRKSVPSLALLGVLGCHSGSAIKAAKPSTVGLQSPGRDEDLVPALSSPRTVFVLQAPATNWEQRLNGWQQQLINHYHEQLLLSGIEMAVIQDITKRMGQDHDAHSVHYDPEKHRPLDDQDVKLGDLSGVGDDEDNEGAEDDDITNEQVLDAGTVGDEGARSEVKAEGGLIAVHSKRVRFKGVNATFDVPWCEVSWKAAIAHAGKEHMSEDGWMSPRWFHGAYQVLWWRYCAKGLRTRSPEYVWFVEHDTYFTGDISQFFNYYAHDSVDLIAAKFRLVGKGWFLWNKTVSSAMKVLPDGKLFTNLNTWFMRGYPRDHLPTMNGGGNRCKLSSDDTTGVVFRQDHVERVSARLLGALCDIMDQKLDMPSECLTPTVCASTFKDCVMVDFAPVRVKLREERAWPWPRFDSPEYCWKGKYDPHSTGHCDGCKYHADWEHAWIHPIKAKRAAVIDCAERCKLQNIEA